jgi:CRP-like cAMP-binding protein
MLRKHAKLELLKTVPLFELCSRRELERIAAVADEIALPAGWALTTEGEPGREFVVLVEGMAAVRRRGRRVNVLTRGDFLGEIALVTDRPRTATVTTTVPSIVLVVTARDFRRVMDELPSIRGKVLEAVAERLPAGDG